MIQPDEADYSTIDGMWQNYREKVLATLPRPFSDIDWMILETTFFAAAHATLRTIAHRPNLFRPLHAEAEGRGKRIVGRLV